MATKIIKEINLYDSKYHFKIGIFCFLFIILILFLLKNINNNNDTIPFVASFNYVEGINNESEVQLDGIKIGKVDKISISMDSITIDGYVDRKYDIPEDSILKIKSNGIFGKKAISIEPGFGEYFDKSKNQYFFNETQDSYSIDTFLRFLKDLNE